jgi:hypothetical protein
MPACNQVSLRSAKRPDDVSWFDYSDVSSSVAKFLKGQADRICRSAGKSVIEIGKHLIGAKHYLSHGAFLRWVECEVGMPARTAQAYMQVAQWASGKNPAVALLPPTLLYLLSAPCTPHEFIVDVLKRAAAGEHISLPAVRGELKALREAKCDESQNEAINGHRPPAHRPRTESASKILDLGATVMGAVAIMARGLSKSDFTRVQEILTSKSVLCDPDFTQKIEAAFRSVKEVMEPRRKLRSQALTPPHLLTAPIKEAQAS